MKFLVAALCFVALAVAAPPHHEHHHDHHSDQVPIVSEESDVSHDGHYFYRFESGDGTKQDQHGEQKVIDKDQSAQVVEGHYSYQGDDGKTYALSYTADENGYRAEGEHLPVAPEIPAAIQRALEYIAAHPQQEETHHSHHH